MTLERSQDFERFFMLAFANEKTRRVWEKWAKGVNAKCEEELEG